MAVRVEYHPRFAGQYDTLAELAQTSDAQWELFAEVTALVNALEEHGHGSRRTIITRMRSATRS